MADPPRRERIVRNRSGCWACKTRRRKCSEEKPACDHCNKKGLKCEYGMRLTWEDAAKEAGIAFGRTGMRNRFKKNEEVCGRSKEHFLLPMTSYGRMLFLNTTYADIYRFCSEYHTGNNKDDEYDKRLETSDQERNGPSFSRTPLGLSIQLRTLPDMDDYSSTIFQYYVKVVCRNKVLVDGARNPFRHLILPLCLSSRTLLHSVLAVAANDLRNRRDSCDDTYNNYQLLYHKSKSLKALRRTFTDHVGFPHSSDVKERDSVLLTVLMHCYLEIASGSRQEWMTHLNGALSIIHYYQDQTQMTAEALFSSSTLKFVREYFSLRDTFSATALDQERYFAKGSWALQLPVCTDFVTEREATRIYIDIGLSQELIDIISATTQLARTKYSTRRNETATPSDESFFRETATNLEARLIKLQQWCEEPDPDHLIYLNAAAFKDAAHIYLRHAGFDEASHLASIQESLVPSLLSLLERIHSKQGNSLGMLPYPMWALFIASCVVLEEKRAIVLNYFAKLKTCRPISNVPMTMDAVEAIWKMRDLAAGQRGRAGCSGTVRVAFEWEEAMVRLGWKMALT
ncbi:hypothetical protein BP6252_05688 [Coleophoma cylindrospora]|uniref:Zn(2)-C6 fungal-type domain-containing protein n=1 Tax=Coleophoma cylindrospora TaxID=1849047 RepID=A0A3D8RUF4_9HELO|nr:hypothetical protein BP6252_05688 [Coleophoma cylindrospora]